MDTVETPAELEEGAQSTNTGLSIEYADGTGFLSFFFMVRIFMKLALSAVLRCFLLNFEVFS